MALVRIPVVKSSPDQEPPQTKPIPNFSIPGNQLAIRKHFTYLVGRSSVLSVKEGDLWVADGGGGESRPFLSLGLYHGIKMMDDTETNDITYY